MPSIRRLLAVAVLLAPSTLALRGLSSCLSELTFERAELTYNSLTYHLVPIFGADCQSDATYTAIMSDASGNWAKGSLGSYSVNDPSGFLFNADESGPRSEQYMITVKQEGVTSESITVPVDVIINGSPDACASSLILDENGGRGASNEIMNIPFVYGGTACGGLTATSTMQDANGQIVAQCESSFPFVSGYYISNTFDCSKTSYFQSGQRYLMQVAVSSSVTGEISTVSLEDATFTFDITSAQELCSIGLQWGSNANGYTFRPGSDTLFVSSVKNTDPGSCIGHVLKPVLQSYPSGTAIECESITFSGNPANDFVSEVRCPVRGVDLANFQMLGGVLDDLVSVPQSSVFPIYVRGQTPDVYSCGASLEFPALAGGVVNYKYRDESKFRTVVSYSTEGACDSSMFTTLELTQGMDFFACDTLNVDESGSQWIECDRVVGSMETGIEWRLEPVQVNTAFKRRDALQIPMEIIPRFEVIHSGELPQSTGDLRRRAREVRAGLKVPGGFTCRRGMTACPIAGRLGSWECIDTHTNLDACGGCPQAGGSDCSELVGVSQVACVEGTCKISQCDSQHTFSASEAMCVPRRRPRFAAPWFHTE